MDKVIAAMRELDAANEAHEQAAHRVDAARLSLSVEQQRLQDHMREQADYGACGVKGCADCW